MAAVDGNASRRFQRFLRYHDFQHTKLAMGGNALGVGAVRQRKATMERATRTLHPGELAAQTAKATAGELGKPATLPST